MRRLRRPFVVTLSALSMPALAGCAREGANPAPAPGGGPVATVTAAPTPTPSAAPSPSPSMSTAPRLADYPKVLNPLDGQGRAIFRLSADNCYVELPWPADKPRMPGEAPPHQKVTCPPEMKVGAWETCSGGAIYAKADRSACICFVMGNPPPPPTVNACVDAPKAELRLRATTAMKMDGDVDADKLVAEANRQIAAVSRCAVMVRKTDSVVGSLNLQVTIAKDGKVTPDLQGPVNEEAKRCLLDAVRAWTIKGAGAGRAMVLLTIE